MHTIALVNQKGGVGKSTTAVNLSAGLARAGKRVLLIDLDPQAHATVALGIDPRKLDRTIYTVLSGQARVSEVMRPASPNLWILPSSIHLAGGEAELASQPEGHSILKNAMAEIGESQFDFAVVDSPPQLGFLNINSLAWVKHVFIPATCEFYALHGLALLMDTVERVRSRFNPQLRISGVITTLMHPRRAITRDVLADLERHFPGRVLKSRIRVNVRLVEAPSHGKSIFDYAPESNGATDYRNLTNEILERLSPEPQPIADVLASVFAGTAEPVVAEAVVETPVAEPVVAEAVLEAPAPVAEPEPVVAETPVEAPAPEPEPVAVEAPAPPSESVPVEIETPAPVAAELPAEILAPEPVAVEAAAQEAETAAVAEPTIMVPQTAAEPELAAVEAEASAPVVAESPAEEIPAEAVAFETAHRPFVEEPSVEAAEVGIDSGSQVVEDEPAPAAETEPVRIYEPAPAEPDSRFVPMEPGAPLVTPVGESIPAPAPVPTLSLGSKAFARNFAMDGLKPIVTSRPGGLPALPPTPKVRGLFGSKLLGKLLGRKD